MELTAQSTIWLTHTEYGMKRSSRKSLVSCEGGGAGVRVAVILVSHYSCDPSVLPVCARSKQRQYCIGCRHYSPRCHAGYSRLCQAVPPVLSWAPAVYRDPGCIERTSTIVSDTWHLVPGTWYWYLIRDPPLNAGGCCGNVGLAQLCEYLTLDGPCAQDEPDLPQPELQT